MDPVSNIQVPGDVGREITYSEATLEALTEEMENDTSIFVVGEGVGPRGGNFNTTKGLYDRFGPMRLRDTPICERGFIGMCTGAAMTGARPIVDFMFIDFILDGMGELINQTAKIQYMTSGRLPMPMVLRGCIGMGNSSATHHSGNYYPIFTHLPGFRVVLPSNAADAKGLFKTAIRSDDPVFFLEHKLLLNQTCHVPEGDYTIPFGEAAIVRKGRDITIVALSVMVIKVLEIANQMRDIDVELIDPRTVAPLDISTILESVKKTGRLLIVDETYMPCGIGAEIAAQVQADGFDDLDAPVHRLNGGHVPAPYSPSLEQHIIPGAEDIEKAIRDLMAE